MTTAGDLRSSVSINYSLCVSVCVCVSSKHVCSLPLPETLTSKGDHQSVLGELQKCLKDTEKESEVSSTPPHNKDILLTYAASIYIPTI